MKNDKDWDGLFKDRTALASSMKKLGEEPVAASFVPEIDHEDAGAKMVADRKEALKNKLLDSFGIKECLIGENLICYAKGMLMYSSVGKGIESALPALSRLRFIDFVQKNGVPWVKVEKKFTKNKRIESEVGYVLFNKDLFTPPSIAPQSVASSI